MLSIAISLVQLILQIICAAPDLMRVGKRAPLKNIPKFENLIF